MKSIKIGNKIISDDSPAFVIAEAACNHMCDMARAKEMICEAKESGSDSIKFQTYKAERLVCDNARAYWKGPENTISQIEYYKKLDKFDSKEYRELFEFARQNEIIAFSTPFDTESASMLNDLGVAAFKIASCDLVDVRLLRHIAKFAKPILLSTGAATFEEIKTSVKTIFDAGNGNLILMACTLSYPTDNRDANLRRLISFKEKFPDLVIGLSDHTRADANMIIPSIAVSLGVKVIEKHFTLDKTLVGSGHFFSVTPPELKKMVENIRLTEVVLGESKIKVYAVEEPARKSARRSLVADREIKKGETITSPMLGVKRPGDGLSAGLIDQVIGKLAKCDIPKDGQIKLEELEEER